MIRGGVARCSRASTSRRPPTHPPGGRTSAGRALLAEAAVEAFDVRVLVGLAGLNVLNGHAADLGPL